MLKKLQFILGVAAITCLSASTVLANNIRPVLGLNGTLQPVFTNIGSTINVTTDQITDAYFSPDSSNVSAEILFFENPFASLAGSNTFGIYSMTDPSLKLEIFQGGDTALTTEAVLFNLDGSVQMFGQPLTVVNGFGDRFGFYLSNPYGIFYSDDSLNPGGAAEALIFKGEGNLVDLSEAYDNIAGCQSGCKTDQNAYYVAFEDLPNSGDKGFNDFVVQVNSIVPVPDGGATLTLLGGALLGLGALRRKFNA